MSKFDDMIRGLQKDIEVPEKVWAKYTDTLSQLPDKPVQEVHKIPKKRMWPVAAAVALMVGTISVSAAVYIQWSKGLDEGLQTTQEQRQTLEENQMASFVNQSVTQGDVTVTAYQSIVDNHFAYLSFKVEGYKAEGGDEPGFSGIDVVVGDGSNDYTGGWSGSFYDGLVIGNDGRAYHADGTPFADKEVSYAMEDGSLEYQIVMTSDQEGYFVDKPIHVEFKDLGLAGEKAGPVEVKAPGDWAFDWTLTGSEEVQTYELNAPLGDSGATVQQAELSPISISLKYDFPRQEIEETAIDDNGEETTHMTYEEPPVFTGVQLKDGTIYTCLAGGGVTGYKGEDSNVYEYIANLNRVIDVNQVESLIFLKQAYPDNQADQQFAQDNLYFVPINE
jgi:hypothetical protein